MMDCGTAKEYIDLYIDQRLSDVQTEQLLSHVKNCDDCRAEFNAAMALKNAFDNIDDVDSPAGLAACAIKKARKSKVPAFAFATAGVAAAAMLIAMLSTGVIGGMRNEAMDITKSESVAYSEPAAEDAPMDAAADFAQTQNTADEATMMESSLAEEAAVDDMAEDAQEADMEMAGIPPSFTIMVPLVSSDSFRQSVEEFLTVHDIVPEYVSSNRADAMTFFVDDASFDDFEALVAESEVRFEGDLFPGSYVTIMFDVD